MRVMQVTGHPMLLVTSSLIVMGLELEKSERRRREPYHIVGSLQVAS